MDEPQGLTWREGLIVLGCLALCWLVVTFALYGAAHWIGVV